ncbi:hypothetical protein QFZ48_000146 [Chitinophaga sp. W2I13]|uniref:hypothetical protein n=1 Tax=Chitinophaga sp. W2I13 TaxID=3373923 RepID=UPI003D22E596
MERINAAIAKNEKTVKAYRNLLLPDPTPIDPSPAQRLLESQIQVIDGLLEELTTNDFVIATT